MQNFSIIILSAIIVLTLSIWAMIEERKRTRIGLIVGAIVWAGILAIAAFTQWGNLIIKINTIY